MSVQIKFGHGQLEVKPDNITAIVNIECQGNADGSVEISRALSQPIGSNRLSEITRKKKPDKIAIIVTDISRPVPYKDILPVILKELKESGISDHKISIYIATGAHRPNSDKEISEVFGPLRDRFQIINHNCDGELVSLGYLSGGNELFINSSVARSDLIITIGAIMPHNLAGFSGGPKLIMPGIAGRKTIENNHRLMMGKQVGPGKVTGNPVHLQIIEAARLAQVAFSLNIVMNQNNEVIKAFAGDIAAAWEMGCNFCREVHAINMPEAEEVVIAGAGGYPRDINLYQAIKAAVNASKLCKQGGTIVLVAKCQDGMGDPIFKEWVARAKNHNDILDRFSQEGFILGGHKAYVLSRLLQKHDIVLISQMPEARKNVPIIEHADNWLQAERYLKEKHGQNYRALILPLAGLIFELSGQLAASGR